MSATTNQEFIAAKAHDYNGVVVDVYAEAGDEGWELRRVTAAGDAQDLIPMFTSSQIDDFDAIVERRWLADGAEQQFDRAMERVGAYLLGAPM